MEPLGRPKWLEKYIKKKPELKEQITILGPSRASRGRGSLADASIMGRPPTYNTGPGFVDKLETHRGEEILAEPTVNALGGSDEVKGIIDGELQKRGGAPRQARAKPRLNANTVSLQFGGSVPKKKIPEDDTGRFDAVTKDYTKPGAGSDDTGRFDFAKTPTFTPTPGAAPAADAVQPITTPTPSGIPSATPTQDAFAPLVTPTVTPTEKAPDEVITPPPIEPPALEKAPELDLAPIEAAPDEVVEAPPLPEDLGAEPDVAQEMLDLTAETARGESPAFKKIVETTFSQLNPALGMQMTKTAMSIAQNPNMTEGAKITRMAEALRNVGISQSNVAIELAKDAMGKATQAAIDAFDMATELSATERQELGEDFNVQWDQLQSFMDPDSPTFDVDKAQEMWKNMRGNAAFAKWMGVEPNWGKIQATYNQEVVDGLKHDIGNLTDEGVEDWELRPHVIAAMEASTGKTVKEIADELGKTEDEVIADEMERYRTLGAQPIDRLLNDYEEAFAEFFDTDAEADAATSAIKRMATGGEFELNEKGHYVVSKDSVLLPWNNPDTAHIFRTELSTDPDQIIEQPGFEGMSVNDPAIIGEYGEVARREGVIAARNDYIDSLDTGQEPMDYDTWNEARESWLAGERAVGDKTYDNEADYIDAYAGAQPGAKTGVLEDDAGEVPIIQTEGAPGEGTLERAATIAGRTYPAGTPVKYDANGDPFVYTYSQAKTDAGGKYTDMSREDIIYYAKTGDTGAYKDFAEIFKTDASVGADLRQGDTLYTALANNLPKTTNAQFGTEAIEGSWHSREGKVIQLVVALPSGVLVFEDLEGNRWVSNTGTSSNTLVAQV